MRLNELEERIAVLNEPSRNHGFMAFSAKKVGAANVANDVDRANTTSDQLREGLVKIGNNESLVVNRRFEESAHSSFPFTIVFIERVPQI